MKTRMRLWLRAFSLAITPALCLSSPFARASSATSAAQYCKFSRDDFLNQFSEVNKNNRISFDNSRGKLKMGLCWWHSLFQRSAVYLTVYRPDLPKPGSDQVHELISKIIQNKGVVEIPGYPDLQSFTHDHEKEIEDELSNWQIADGFMRQKWIIGLHGGGSDSPEGLKKKMDHIYETFQSSHVTQYVKLKMQGMAADAHALLVIGMDKTDGGYRMSVIDSNTSEITLFMDYKFGDKYINGNLFVEPGWKFVPYLEHESDLEKIKSAMKDYCADQGGSRFASDESPASTVVVPPRNDPEGNDPGVSSSAAGKQSGGGNPETPAGSSGGQDLGSRGGK